VERLQAAAAMVSRAETTGIGRINTLSVDRRIYVFVLEFYPDLGYVVVVLGNIDSDGTQTIATHVRASVTARFPWGRDEALIFLNELLPAAPDVVVQVAHLASAGSAEDEGAEQALDLFVDAGARNDPRTRNLYFDATTLGEPPTPASAQRWARAISGCRREFCSAPMRRRPLRRRAGRGRRCASCCR
jgi:hypothetical protein